MHKYNTAEKSPNSATDSLIGINVLTYGLSKISRLTPFMDRNFIMHSRGRPWTIASSMFYHKGIFHLVLNMLALNSFGRMLESKIGSTNFLSLYLSSGLASAGFSKFVKMRKHDYAGSLGASGAIFGAIGACAHDDHVRISAVFLPGHSMELRDAFKCLMLFESCGLLLGWRIFDHAAHLAGGLFGYLALRTAKPGTQ